MKHIKLLLTWSCLLLISQSSFSASFEEEDFEIIDRDEALEPEPAASSEKESFEMISKDELGPRIVDRSGRTIYLSQDTEPISVPDPTDESLAQRAQQGLGFLTGVVQNWWSSKPKTPISEASAPHVLSFFGREEPPLSSLEPKPPLSSVAPPAYTAPEYGAPPAYSEDESPPAYTAPEYGAPPAYDE